eukprot:365152-Chlamydomonas_euryale.AAC.3
MAGLATCRNLLPASLFPRSQLCLPLSPIPPPPAPSPFIHRRATRAAAHANTTLQQASAACPHCKEAYVAVLDDLSHLPVDAFWAAMDSVGRLWRHNARGCPLSLPDFSALVPCSLHELADDPYRSLAAVLRRAGGYVKSRVPYSEFRWANYLRERLPLAAGPGSNEAGGGGDGGGGAAVADAAVVAALPEALRIAEAVDAAAAWRLGLPGRGEQPACSEGRLGLPGRGEQPACSEGRLGLPGRGEQPACSEGRV